MTIHEAAPSPEPPGPQPIRRLHESLINRIAAGEVRTGLIVIQTRISTDTSHP
jgi:hypothetical protein